MKKKKKDFEISQAQKEVESLKKLLKEKDETIKLLKNNSINESSLNNNLNNDTSLINNSQLNQKINKRKNSSPILKKENSISINNELTLFKNSINYSKNKLKKNKSNSNISYIIYKNKPNEKRVHNRCKSNKMQNINISYNNIAFIQNKNDNISNNSKKNKFNCSKRKIF